MNKGKKSIFFFSAVAQPGRNRGGVLAELGDDFCQPFHKSNPLKSPAVHVFLSFFPNLVFAKERLEEHAVIGVIHHENQEQP